MTSCSMASSTIAFINVFKNVLTIYTKRFPVRYKNVASVLNAYWPCILCAVIIAVLLSFLMAR